MPDTARLSCTAITGTGVSINNSRCSTDLSVFPAAKNTHMGGSNDIVVFHTAKNNVSAVSSGKRLYKCTECN